MKPGHLTTEFYLALLVVILGAIAVEYDSSPLARIGGAVAAALASIGYGFSRAKAKESAASVVEATLYSKNP